MHFEVFKNKFEDEKAIIMAMMNHVDTPFLFSVENTKLLNCYEYT